MKIYYQKQNIPVEICTTFKKRLLGIMFQKKKIEKAYLFPKCNSIHTFFCYQNIDLFFLNKEGKILSFHQNVTKNKIIIFKKAYSALELPTNYFSHIQEGEYLKIMEDL